MAQAKELPASFANKRFIGKAEKLAKISKILKTIDPDPLVDAHFMIDSSSLGLYNALIESIDLDRKRILDQVKSNKEGA